jgi:crossover junction endodeoxyribonuclease RuvC
MIKKIVSHHPFIQSSAHPAIILGIDPGLQRTGWGVIKANANQLSFIDCGVVRSDPDLTIDERVKQIHDGLAIVIATHCPAEAAVEETFVNESGSSTLKLGQARGAILLTLSLHNLKVYEYGANKVKKSVVGSGHADKKQVAMMVKMLLPASNAKQADAADALAVAICHANHRPSHALKTRLAT